MWSPGLPVKLPWDGGRKTAIPHGAIDNMIQLSYGYDLPDNRGKPRAAQRVTARLFILVANIVAINF